MSWFSEVGMHGHCLSVFVMHYRLAGFKLFIFCNYISLNFILVEKICTIVKSIHFCRKGFKKVVMDEPSSAYSDLDNDEVAKVYMWIIVLIYLFIRLICCILYKKSGYLNKKVDLSQPK